uniref:Uncharacterized protein n=1 Tax=Pithovirus LCPAC104 TaxID=2506589 RepID=A0A481Z461_9VIRU|nr:MAG: hypothetical protein LCPAC104_01510 [Pithovirus LCPAC104]
MTSPVAATSPPSSPRTPRESSKSFRNDVTQLKDYINTIFKVYDGIIKSPVNSVLINNVSYDAKDMVQLKRQFRTKLDNLNKAFREGQKISKPKRTVAPGSGFNRPIKVSDKLVRFFREANLGTYENQNLQTFLPQLFRENISLPSTLNALFNLYAKTANLVSYATENKNKKQSDYNKQFLGADENMKRVFASDFVFITNKTKDEMRARNVKEGDIKEGAKELINKPGFYRATDYIRAFDPDNFIRARLSNIIYAPDNFSTHDVKIDDREKKAYGVIKEDYKARAKEEEAKINKANRKIARETGKKAVEYKHPINYNEAIKQIQNPSQNLKIQAQLDSEQSIVSSVLARTN